MLKKINNKGKPSGTWITLGELIARTLQLDSTITQSFRVTYSKKEYCGVFPRTLISIEARRLTSSSGKPKKRDLRFKDNAQARCFLRNLWFLNRFFSKPGEVIEFLDKTTVQERRITLFQNRLLELEELGETYRKWSISGERIRQVISRFSPTETDLLSVDKPSSISNATPSPEPRSSTALADLIREVEERLTYKAGNPEDACEKAFYFFELGRRDIANRISDDVLAVNPKNSVALFTKAVFWLDAASRHSGEAFQHELMHPSDLIPIEAEEFYHIDAANEARRKASEAAEASYQLLIKSRLNWPIDFRLKSVFLDLNSWKTRIENYLLNAMASRVVPIFDGTSLPDPFEAERRKAFPQLKKLLREIWKERKNWKFRPDSPQAFGDLLVVASILLPQIGKQCLNKASEALVDKHGDDWESISHCDYRFRLPVQKSNVAADSLYELFGESRYYRALYRLMTAEDVSNLLRLVETKSNLHRQDQLMLRNSLITRAWIHGNNDISTKILLCRRRADSECWPETLLGQKLRRCWRYSYVYLLLRSSWLFFDKDNNRAIQIAEETLQIALKWIHDLKGEAPLLFFRGEEDFEPGDFLYGEPNVITDPSSCFSWFTYFAVIPFEKVPTGFREWLKAQENEMPLLIAYATWLFRQTKQESEYEQLIIQLQELIG